MKQLYIISTIAFGLVTATVPKIIIEHSEHRKYKPDTQVTIQNNSSDESSECIFYIPRQQMPPFSFKYPNCSQTHYIDKAVVDLEDLRQKNITCNKFYSYWYGCDPHKQSNQVVLLYHSCNMTVIFYIQFINPPELLYDLVKTISDFADNVPDISQSSTVDDPVVEEVKGKIAQEPNIQDDLDKYLDLLKCASFLLGRVKLDLDKYDLKCEDCRIYHHSFHPHSFNSKADSHATHNSSKCIQSQYVLLDLSRDLFDGYIKTGEVQYYIEEGNFIQSERIPFVRRIEFT